jgi:uncharacterized protein YndB with AHSA1/START domain
LCPNTCARSKESRDEHSAAEHRQPSTARLGGDSIVTLNEHAPVLASSEVAIAADQQTVWNVLTAFERWPDWNADVSTMWLQGDGKAGTTFRWKTRSNTINSRIEHVDPPSRILWTGKSSGSRATHLHELEARGNGTLVRTTESFEGLVARVLRTRLKKVVQAALDSELRQLKIEAEKRSAGGTAA